MPFLRKLNKKLNKMFDGQVAARTDSGRLVLSGELERWSDIVLAGITTVKKNPYNGFVNEILCSGETPLPIRKPRIEDGALEWEEPDVLIIGGGVIGCAIARELSRFKLSVLLVEKEHDLAMQASGRNDGMVQSGYDLRKNTLKHRYNKLGNQMFDRVCEELGVEFDRCGQLVYFANRAWEPFIFLSLIYWKWLGLKDVKVIKKEELRMREPAISQDIRSALFFPAAGVVSPFSLTIAYAENAVHNGVSISFDTMVQGMKVEDGMIKSVTTNRGTVHPKVVVNAAGAFCEDIATIAGDRFYSIRPRKGSSAILDKKYSNILVKTPVSSFGTTIGRKMMHTKGGSVIRTIYGNCLVGPDTLETINKEDFTTVSQNISNILSALRKTCPALDEKQIISYFSGIRAATYEEDFVICKGRYISNIVHAAGMQQPGLTAAPAIGVSVAGMVADLFGGDGPLEQNPDFDPIRKAPPRPALMDIEAREQLIANDPDYGVIICKCEEISRGEILEALRRNVRCDSIDGVKRRVRPGAGRCQGSYCSPQVLSLISAERRHALHRVKKSGSGSEILYGSAKAILRKQTSSMNEFKESKTDKETEARLHERAREMLAASIVPQMDKDYDDDE